MIRHKLVLVACCALLGLGLYQPAHGQATPNATPASNPGVMTVLVEQPPTDLDPASSYDENSNIPMRGLYEGLVTLDGAALDKTVPALANKIDNQDNKNTVFTFHLQQGVKFHDGTPFDASAAKFGLTRTVKDKQGTDGILGTFLTDPDKMIQVVDAQTLRVTFDHPQPFFLLAMAASYGTGFVSPTAVQKNAGSDDGHTWLTTHEAGTGPYMLATDAMPSTDQMGAGTPMMLKQFAGYWRGWTGSHFTQIAIKVQPESALRRRALEQGTADAATVLLPDDIVRLQKDNTFQFNLKPTLRVDMLIMAASYGKLANPKVRQAMTYAFDYAAYNKAELGGLGIPTNGPFPNTLLGWDNTLALPVTDLKTALSKLNDAGINLKSTLADKTNQSLQVSLTYASSQGRGDQAGAILQRQLEQLGISLTIYKTVNQKTNMMEKLALKDYNNLLSADKSPDRPDFFLQSWWPDYNSPLNYTYPLFYSKSTGANGQNAGYYSDPTLDQLIEQAQKGTTPDQIIAPFKSVQKILGQDGDPAAIFMGQSPDRTVVSGTIKNQVFNALYLGTFDFYAISRG